MVSVKPENDAVDGASSRVAEAASFVGAFDPSVAHPARVYNAWLGGKDNSEADRDVAALVVHHRPQAVVAARENRRFLARVVRYLAQCHGIRQFLDIGSGLPGPCNTHEVAQAVDVLSRVVYVDNDPVVVAHALALATSTLEGCCDYVQADLRDPGYVLRQATKTLDLSLPVAVLLLAVLHFVADGDGPAEVVAELADALAPGSCVAISHLTADFAPDAVGGGVAAYNKLVPTAIFPRSHRQVTDLLAGLSLVAPGVVPISEWRLDTVVHAVSDLYGGVACKRARRR
jgi:SAM-dependent methyltransferase